MNSHVRQTWVQRHATHRLRAAAVVLVTALAAGRGGFAEPADKKPEGKLIELELPIERTVPFDIDALENPLFGPGEAGAPQEMPPPPPARPASEFNPEIDLPIPAPGEAVPEAKPESTLLRIARAVVGSVLSLKAYDKFGVELARSAGFFVSASGVVMTDISLTDPLVDGRIAYITAVAGDGTASRISGVWRRDPVSGVVLLQAETKSAVPLELRQTIDPGKGELPAAVIALDDKRGLLLADAFLSVDETAAGRGWLNIRGDDSAGEVGSPVLDHQGRVVAMVAMRLPLQQWLNFGVPVAAEAARIATLQGAPLPLARLERLPAPDIAQDENFLRAFSLLYDGRFRESAKLLLQLSRRYPRSPEVWALLGLASARLGAGSEALLCQQKAVSLDPEAGSLWYQLAVADLRSASTTEAKFGSAATREALENAVKQRPGDRVSWMLLAQACIVAGDFKSADRALLQVTKIEPDYSRAFYLLGYVRGKLRDYESAEMAVRKAVSLNSRSEEAWFYLGLLYAKQKRHAEAIDAFQRAVRIDPGHPHASVNLAHEYLATGNRAEARLVIDRFRKREAKQGLERSN